MTKTVKILGLILFATLMVLVMSVPRPIEGQSALQRAAEAPTTALDARKDDLFNGLGIKGSPVDECVAAPVANRSFEDNKFIFNELETVADGLGPVYNDAGCGSCHQAPIVGGISQSKEMRAGFATRNGFVNPPGGSLIHLRAIAANVQERLDNISPDYFSTLRTTLNVIGDGFIEAISGNTIGEIRSDQPAGFKGTIINVPVVEARGRLRVARFGWKNQHASLVSFSGDAYLNEMGITNVFDGSNGRVENTSMGASVKDYDGVADPEDDGDDVEAFANFMRATRAPGRGPITNAVLRGEDLFHKAACSICHTPSITTAPAGTVINAGEFTVPPALGNKVIHPFSDFMLHDIGTGDGIVQNGGEATRNMVRTPPLWGVRTRIELMHDGLATTYADAIERHAGQATFSRNVFHVLSNSQKADLVAFLTSL